MYNQLSNPDGANLQKLNCDITGSKVAKTAFGQDISTTEQINIAIQV